MTEYSVNSHQYEPKKKLRLLEKINITSLVISIIAGVLISFIFHQIQNIKSKPTFIIHPLRVNVIDFDETANSVPDTILADLKQSIRGDLNVCTYYFFNQGKKPIRSEDVLKNFIIYFQDPSVILVNHNLLDTGRDVCNINTVLNNNTIEIEFEILEKQDGIIGQIVYQGDLESTIEFSGIVEGVNRIRDRYLGFSGLSILLIGLLIASFIWVIIQTRSENQGPYRIVILEEDTFEEVGYVRASRISLSTIAIIYSLLIGVATIILLWILGFLDLNPIQFFREPLLN